MAHNTADRIEIEVAAGGFFARRVSVNDRLVLEAVGPQCVDFASVSAADPLENLSMYCSRAIPRNWRLTEGDTLYSSRAQPMWRILADTARENYCGGGFCGERINYGRYGVAGTHGCDANFRDALHEVGLPTEAVGFDSCFNIWMTVAYEPDGGWEIEPPKSSAGDRMVLESCMDQYVLISNCPQTLNEATGKVPQPLLLSVNPAGAS